MLKVGLINCDCLTPQVIEQYGDYPNMFRRLLTLVSKDITLKIYNAVAEELPQNTAECDVYLISGSQFSVCDQEPWIASLLSFIQVLWSKKIKTVGVCFGHQVMSKALGGIVNKAPNGWGMGLVNTMLVHQQSWMRPYQKTFNIYMSHQDQVLTIPEEGMALAKTQHCPYSMIQFSDIFLSIQGHPEFNQNYMQFLIDKRKHIFQQAIYQSFIESLSNTPDTTLLATWIMNFFLENRS